MFRKALIRLGVSLVLVASVSVLATASGGSAGVGFVTTQPYWSHDGSPDQNPCPGAGINERHYCLLVTTYNNLNKSGGVEVDLTLQNYDQSALTNPTTTLSWTPVDASHPLSFVSSDRSICSSPTDGQVNCSFPNLPGLGSAAAPGTQTPCITPVPSSGPICSTVKLFFNANSAGQSVTFNVKANAKESQPNGANVDSQKVDAAVMNFNDGTANADATVALPQSHPKLSAILARSSVAFPSGSSPFLAQFQASQLQPSSAGTCFPGIACTGLQLATDLSGAPIGTFSASAPILWTADVASTNTNVLAVHYYDPVQITTSTTPKTFQTAGTSFANCDGVNFGSDPNPPGDLDPTRDYYAINKTTSGGNTSFQVATSATGKPLSFTGNGPFSGSCIRIIGDQKSEKTTACTSTAPPTQPVLPPVLCAAKVPDAPVPTVRVYLWDAANGKISL